MKFIAFDLESYCLEQPFGISVAATLKSGYTPQVWHTGDLSTPQAMTKGRAIMLVDYLLAAREDKYTPLSWNGVGFDFKVLAEVSGRYADCVDIALNSVDMMFQFYCLFGFPVGLDAIAKGAGLLGKGGHEDVSGSQAPVAWQGSVDDRSRVVDYVKDDVRATLAVAELVSVNKAFKWLSKKGRPMNKPFDGKWKTVGACLSIPLPDTSWMTGESPFSREYFLSWTEEVVHE